MQGRLLRVLQEREVLRIGAEGVIPVDIRVIAASNKSLQKLLQNGLIREE
jgi:transcriptional regulator with PAS, ATPase and Fis domain